MAHPLHIRYLSKTADADSGRDAFHSYAIEDGKKIQAIRLEKTSIPSHSKPYTLSISCANSASVQEALALLEPLAGPEPTEDNWKVTRQENTILIRGKKITEESLAEAVTALNTKIPHSTNRDDFHYPVVDDLTAARILNKEAEHQAAPPTTDAREILPNNAERFSRPRESGTGQGTGR